MKRTVGILGIIAFWCSWPLLYVYLKRRERTRVLLVANNKVLLVRTWHGPGNWSLPGGGMHQGEDPTGAVKRELTEETGVIIDVNRLRVLGKKTHTEYGLKFVCNYFYSELDAELIARPRLPEILHAEWVEIDQLAKYKLGPDSRYALSAYTALIQ